MNRKLSEIMECFRSDRPDEWMMGEWIDRVKELEEVRALTAQSDHDREMLKTALECVNFYIHEYKDSQDTSLMKGTESWLKRHIEEIQ